MRYVVQGTWYMVFCVYIFGVCLEKSPAHLWSAVDPEDTHNGGIVLDI